MATTTTSIRLNDDRLEQFNLIKTSFDSGSDFADWIIETHKLYATSKESALFEQDGKAIADMFSSILAIYNGAIARAEGMVRAKDATIQEELRSKDMKYDELQAEIALLREELSLKDQEISTAKQSVKDVSQELKSTQEDLVKLQKDLTTTQKLNDMLESEKAQYAAISEKNNVLNEEVTSLRNELRNKTKTIETLEKDLSESKYESNESIKSLVARSTAVEAEHKNELLALNKEHTMALERLEMRKDSEIDKLKLEIEKAIVEAHKEAQGQVKEYMQSERDLLKQIDQLKIMLASEKQNNIELNSKLTSLEATSK